MPARAEKKFLIFQLTCCDSYEVADPPEADMTFRIVAVRRCRGATETNGDGVAAR